MHIRRITISALLLTGFFSIALLASANSTNLSSDPSYATGPFLFYCQPYTQTFQSGVHYTPQSGPCIFSQPQSIPGGKTVAVYKGVPGNSILMATENAVGSPTLMQIDSVNFGSPANEQGFFGAVYNSGSASDFATYFTTGSSTNATPPTPDFGVLAWKWGPKPPSEFEPVVIVPDMFGSVQKDTGPLLDPIFQNYDNLINTLVSSGYIQGQTLFTFPYDWQASNASTSQALGLYIQTIKSTCGCSRVNVVAHGMGGIVTEHYIESGSYANDVDSVFFLGTPFIGAPAAYQAWEGGQVNFGNPLADGLAQVLLNAQAKEGGYASTFAYVQGKPILSFKEILPVYNYLSNPSDMPYPTGYPRNTFIENIASQFSSKILNKVRLRIALGDNGLGQTTSGFGIAPSSQPPLWPEGQPNQVFTDAGDGFTPRFSIENFIGFADVEYSTSHAGLPDAAQSDIFSFFNGANPSTLFTTSHPVSCVLFVSTSATTNLLVTDPSGARLGKDLVGSGEFSEIAHSFYSGPNAVTEYVAIANPLSGAYQVQTQGTASGSFTINTSDVCGNGTVSTSTNATTGPGQLIGFGLAVSTSTQTLNIQSLDTHPPLVTITSPQNNTTYLTSQTIPITTIVTDPENSPIATTTYRVNGALVNPTQSLATSTLGTSTLAVAATDIFGNTGYATSTFAFISPVQVSTDCVLALSATAKPAVKLTSSSMLKAQNCKVQVNSNATGALDLSGSAMLTSTGNCVVGTVVKTGSSIITPAATSCPAKADPYASHAKPAVGACSFTNMSITGSQIKSINPGVYCGGLTVSGSSIVTLNPGLYIMKGGPLNINSSAIVKGDGVSFFLTGTNAGITIGGSAQLKTTPMSSGTLNGFAFFLEPTGANGTANTKSTLSDSVIFNVAGVVYLPKQQFLLTDSVIAGGTVLTTYIADTFSLSNSVQLKTNGRAVAP